MGPSSLKYPPSPRWLWQLMSWAGLGRADRCVWDEHGVVNQAGPCVVYGQTDRSITNDNSSYTKYYWEHRIYHVNLSFHHAMHVQPPRPPPFSQKRGLSTRVMPSIASTSSRPCSRTEGKHLIGSPHERGGLTVNQSSLTSQIAGSATTASRIDGKQACALTTPEVPSVCPEPTLRYRILRIDISLS